MDQADISNAVAAKFYGERERVPGRQSEAGKPIGDAVAEKTGW